MQQNILQSNIVQLLGIDALSIEEQSAFLAEVGEVILQTALVRLVESITDEQQHALEQYLETSPEPDVLMQHLFEHFSDFQIVLEDAILEFKEDALAVLSSVA